jgi:hypothetical protein
MAPVMRFLLAATAFAIAMFTSLAPSAAASPICSKRTATRLEQRLPVTPYNFGRHLGQAKCLDFTGDGREDIVFTGWEFMNHGAHYWAAFRATRTNWVRVKFKRSCCRADPKTGVGIAIQRSGREIGVTQPVYDSDDPACCPSGGSKTGWWGWRRRQLVLLDVVRDS